jgi:hypothetical protein
MAGSNILEERMLEETLAAFGEGSPTTLSAGQGIALIDGWLQSLRGDGGVSHAVNKMASLRTQLLTDQPDIGIIRQLLTELADHAAEVAQGPTAEGTWTGGLQRLSVLLRNFSSQF